MMDNQYFRGQKDSIGQVKHRWGSQTPSEDPQINLLSKKDQQIKRLQSQLQNERKRADNALKMLDSFRSSHKIEEEISSNAKSQISRRLKAQEQARKLRAQNEILKSLLAQHLQDLKGYENDLITISNR